MNYTIQEGKHSADKNHVVMTWWTLTVDKIIQCDDGVSFYTYSIPMYKEEFNEEFHKWVHTAEHLLAYKKDTGSVRNSLEEVSKWTLQGKVILDISPYKTGEDTFGFRITSMIPLNTEQVQEFTKISITRAIEFLENGIPEDESDYEWIPFARNISCGQFTFHNKEKAITDLKKSVNMSLDIEEKHITSKHTTAYVCDLRFLKPKIEKDDNLVMFSPDFSYKISELIEKELPKVVPETITIVGTFGCMTGMYLCVSSKNGDESDIPFIHKKIIHIITSHIERESLSNEEKIQLDTLLENYKNFCQK